MAEDTVMDLDDSELSSLSGEETDGPSLPKRSIRPQKGGDSVENGQTRKLITDGFSSVEKADCLIDPSTRSHAM